MEPIDKRDEPSAVLMSDSRDRLTPHDPSEKPIFSSGDVICDRYRVIRFIARGGMGEVYEVEDWELQSRIALKTIAPERASSTRQVGRFRQEIQLARKVSHPNVCRVFDLGRHKMSATPLPANAARSGDPGADRDVLFLTMELLQGQTLSAYLEERGPMTPEQALPIVRQLVSALAAAHHMGIVHRDFKPGNVMLEETPEGLVAKVTDFGLATNPQSDETVSRSLTQVLGTPEYMAPEQLRGQCSNRTDIYALGLTVFQMLTGALPISPDTASKGLKTSETGKRTGHRWRAAISKCLASNPAERFASVEEFWYAVSGERVAGQFGWKAIAASTKRYWVIYAGAACLLIAAIAAVLTGAVPNPFRRLPEQKHIAVLPFENIGNDTSNRAFAEGVAESLTSKLSQLERYQKSFWVVPSSDTRNIKSLDEAYRNLGVTLAVTGSIEHTADGVNLTADLVDPKDHRQLASRSIRVSSANLDEMQQRVWESVADMLDLQVSRKIKDELAAGGTNQPHAFELYERGVGYLKSRDLEGTNRAIGLFNQAIVDDPNYAQAYAGLGDAYSTKYSLTKDPQWIAAATQNAARAVQLNDQLIPVRITLARVYQETGQLDKALAENQKVLEQDPSVIEVEYRIGQIYQMQGKYPQAEGVFKDAIARRPTYWQGYDTLGALYYQQGQFAKAVEQFRSVIDLAPDEAVGYYNLGGSYIALGRYQDAIEVLKKGLSIQADPSAWTNLGAVYMYVGKWEDAAEAMKKATEMVPNDHALWRNLGDSYDQIPARRAEARQAYAKALQTATAALKVNPRDPVVLSGIALYEAHLGNSQQAEEFINRALEVAPQDSDTLFTSALVYELTGHREQALKAVQAAVKAGFSLDEVDKEPELRGLQSDPRYRQWVQEEKKAEVNTGVTKTS